jgi:hypothetical protein
LATAIHSVDSVELLEAIDVDALQALAPTHSRQLAAIKRSLAQRRA